MWYTLILIIQNYYKKLCNIIKLETTEECCSVYKYKLAVLEQHSSNHRAVVSTGILFPHFLHQINYTSKISTNQQIFWMLHIYTTRNCTPVSWYRNYQKVLSISNLEWFLKFKINVTNILLNVNGWLLTPTINTLLNITRKSFMIKYNGFSDLTSS